MANKWYLLVVALAATLALLALGCSSDEAGVVVEAGASSDTSSAPEPPSPTDTPSLDESFAHDDDTTAEPSEGENTGHEDENTDHSDQDQETLEPEAADHEDEQNAVEEEDGSDDPASEPTDDSIVPVVMNEFGYIIEQTEFALGSTITFEFVNEGAIEHEAMFGTPHEQEEFRADTDHGGAGHHGDVVAILLATDESGTLTITLEEPGEIVIGCHLPGHWEAGMATTLMVT